MRVEYFEIQELPGKRMFRCEAKRASLSTEACSVMWTGAQSKSAPERLDGCRNCQIGAIHAGVGDASLSQIHGKPLCARCGCGATRLIAGTLCISCYNRQREYIKGRNARGNAPKGHPPLYSMAIRYRAGSLVITRSGDHVACVDELVLAALRDEAKQVTFAFAAHRPMLRQQELFL